MTKKEKEKYKDSAFIYSLEFPEGNIRYIGKTINPKRRLTGHIYPFREQKHGYKWNWINSLLKKGERPIMNIVDIVPREEVDFWEIHYIALYKSFGFKLTNATFGGDGQSGMTEETRQKICEKVRIYKKTHDVWNKGIKCPEERKIKFSLGHERCGNGILQFDSEGHFVKEFRSSGHINKDLGYDITSILQVCRGKYKSFNDFIFLFKDEYESDKDLLRRRIKEYETKKEKFQKNESILSFNLKGDFLEKYDNRWQAHKELNIDSTNIAACCRHQYSQIRGIIFVFEKEYNENPNIVCEKIKIAKRSSKAKRYFNEL